MNISRDSGRLGPVRAPWISFLAPGVAHIYDCIAMLIYEYTCCEYEPQLAKYHPKMLLGSVRGGLRWLWCLIDTQMKPWRVLKFIF